MTAQRTKPFQPDIRPTTSMLTLANRWDHFLARWGVNRMGYRVEPGLCALGDPTPESPALVMANYTLSFDALRSALTGIDGCILIVDTEGINVWCALRRAWHAAPASLTTPRVP